MSSIYNHWRYRHILRTLEDSLNLQRRGVAMGGRTVGDTIATIIALGVIRNVNQGKDPDGRRLPPLKRRYRDWKIRHGFNQAILRMTDAMMRFQQVKGMVVISRDAMTMFYGLDQQAQQKAEWAHEGTAGKKFQPGLTDLFQSWGRPPRPFYGITDYADKTIDIYCDGEIDELIMSLGARRK